MEEGSARRMQPLRPGHARTEGGNPRGWDDRGIARGVGRLVRRTLGGRGGVSTNERGKGAIPVAIADASRVFAVVVVVVVGGARCCARP